MYRQNFSVGSAVRMAGLMASCLLYIGCTPTFNKITAPVTATGAAAGAPVPVPVPANNQAITTPAINQVAPVGTATTVAPKAAFQTTSQPINATAAFSNLTWNLDATTLGSNPIPGTPSAQFQIAVRTAVLPDGTSAYIFNDPWAQGGATGLEIQGVNIIINGVPQPATIYSNMDRFIPASPNNRTMSATAQIIRVTPKPGDTVAISFNNILPSNFNPPTYAALTAPTGIFGMKCATCHNPTSAAQGFANGLDLANWAFLIANAEAIPFDANNSFIYQRITNSVGFGFMPLGQAPLTAAEVDQVRQWLLDGAPNN